MSSSADPDDPDALDDVGEPGDAVDQEGVSFGLPEEADRDGGSATATVVSLLVLAVVGAGGAFAAYRRKGSG